MALKLTEITFSKIQDEINFYLQTVYNKASQLFSVASPFGQLLTIIEELHQLSILYLKNSMNQFDLSDPNSNNYNIVRSAAVVAGHNPTRSISASGTLSCKVAVTTDIAQSIPGGKVKIINKTTIKNNTNGLLYHIDLGGSDEQVYDVNNGKAFLLNIAQGEWKDATYTGTGQINQTYEIESEGKEIENHKIEVTVNGEYWQLKNHLYEMSPTEKAVVVRTSFNGGLTVIFGNGSYGFVPPINSVIKVDYVESDGDDGNIYRRTSNDWKFIDDVLTQDGASLEFERNFNIFIRTDINFGANGESIKLMKNLLPLNMNNFVLALPEQYSYSIKKLGVFSHVNAWDDNGTIKIVATPNIRIFKNRNADYFTVDKKAFKLDSYEKSKLDSYLRIGGYIQLTKKYKIDTPVLSYYVMYINLRLFDDAIEENVNSQIINVVSEYFLDLNRLDRIPRKDMINIISEVDGVDSVDVRFVSKKNEDYHRRFKTTNEDSLTVQNNSLISSNPSTPTLTANNNRTNSLSLKTNISIPDLNNPGTSFDVINTSEDSNTTTTTTTSSYEDSNTNTTSSYEDSITNISSPSYLDFKPKYDPKKVLGVDKTLGDIIFEPNEYPIIRGGWIDRNEIYYSEVPLDGFSSINISVKGLTPRKQVANR
tara:strand:- start:19716 stop:21665 length:1950 start_codon:yes stop_codon:yes gene_type:complete